MRKSECGLRPVGFIRAYAPEGMRKDGVGEGFIPSLRTVSIALKLLSGCLMIFREGINPSPTLIVMLSIIFNCVLIGPNPKPLSYETTL